MKSRSDFVFNKIYQSDFDLSKSTFDLYSPVWYNKRKYIISKIYKSYRVVNLVPIKYALDLVTSCIVVKEHTIKYVDVSRLPDYAAIAFVTKYNIPIK